ncbi:hypothetical protein BJ973_001028 [Actinoplanes tereljensis]|uniref:Uncharacterized protein n=1 Tax=Paractinoplanes tereljensis TaxID=571912 RepID=A0A919TYV9_9ACTN|nr:hypothetical protein [Actinoplanes tereljensis]GIF26584.1 hypothetical protein Ate02nite_93140 [Actinoplanes tereljensis]
MGISACGDDADTAAGTSTTTVASAAAPAAEATTAAAAGVSDKELCEQANKAADSFKKAALTLAAAGDIPVTDAKAMLTDFASTLTKLADSGDGAVATALKANADAALQAAGEPNPVEAADTPESEKAGKDLNAACKAAGVTTVF